MKNVIILLAGVIFFGMLADRSHAQGCDAYFVTGEGALREMKSYDKKDKLTGTIRQEVIEIKDITGGKSITVAVDSYDKKDELVFSDEMTMTCKDGIFSVDMKSYLNYEMMAGLEGITVSIDAKDLEMPTDLSTGMELPDGHIQVNASNMGIPILNMEVRIYDRKVEGRETITTPAGTFDCYKLSYSTEIKTIGRIVAKGVEWIALDIGSVRSETYDKNNKLESYTVLTELKQ